ncbi:hypothetical protein [Nocardia terrae]|uniref:hypothetical protein n=1 Tax=Nocardia terrae TaxID=2675851 RepID=UPI001F3418A7|nr:hypothetical protein [Nocardia terrae]
MDMAAHERPSTTGDHAPDSAPAAPPASANSGRPQHRPDTGPGSRGPEPRLGLLARLSSQFGSRGLSRRGPALDDAARRELLLHGVEGTATILSVRSSAKVSPPRPDSLPEIGSTPIEDRRTGAPRAESGLPMGARFIGADTAPEPLTDIPAAAEDTDPDGRTPDARGRSGRRTDIRTGAEKRVDARAAAARRVGNRDADVAEPGLEFWVRIQLEDRHAYETRVRQRVNAADQEYMEPGDIVCCRVDPGDHDRVVLYLPAPDEISRTNIAKILTDGRRARATVLAATPVAADYTGRDDPVLRLDLELRAWDEPGPWRVRLIQPVPLSAMELIDLGRHLEVAFFTVDRGESVAVDWAASREL